MGIPIDPELAENYRAIVEDENDPRTWKDIAKMADEQASPTLAAYAREQAAAKGGDVTPAAAVPSYKNTRSKGLHKDPDGVNEPPESIDKVTPGTRFPTVKPGDVTPVSVDPTGTIDGSLKQVSQNPSTAVDTVLEDPTDPAPAVKEKDAATTAAPTSTADAEAKYNTQPPSSAR